MCRKHYCVILLHNHLRGHDRIEGLNSYTQTSINVILKKIKASGDFSFVWTRMFLRVGALSAPSIMISTVRSVISALASPLIVHTVVQRPPSPLTMTFVESLWADLGCFQGLRLCSCWGREKKQLQLHRCGVLLVLTRLVYSWTLPWPKQSHHPPQWQVNLINDLRGCYRDEFAAIV